MVAKSPHSTSKDWSGLGLETVFFWNWELAEIQLFILSDDPKNPLRRADSYSGRMITLEEMLKEFGFTSTSRILEHLDTQDFYPMKSIMERIYYSYGEVFTKKEKNKPDIQHRNHVPTILMAEYFNEEMAEHVCTYTTFSENKKRFDVNEKKFTFKINEYIRKGDESGVYPGDLIWEDLRKNFNNLKQEYNLNLDEEDIKKQIGRLVTSFIFNHQMNNIFTTSFKTLSWLEKHFPEKYLIQKSAFLATHQLVSDRDYEEHKYYLGVVKNSAKNQLSALPEDHRLLYKDIIDKVETNYLNFKTQKKQITEKTIKVL